MNSPRFLPSQRRRWILVGAISATTAVAVHAQTANVGVVAADSAATSSMTNSGTGTNGGFGFAAGWQGFNFTGGATNGTFNGGPTTNNGFTGGTDISTTGNTAWGMYNGNGADAGNFRGLSTGLQVGQSFSFDFDNGFINSGQRQQVILFGPSNDRLSFGFTGDDSAYTMTNGAGTTIATFATGFTTSGLHVTITLTGTDTFSATIGQAGATDVVTGTLGGTAGSGLTGVTVKDNDTTTGAAHDFFTNSMFEYTPTVIAGGSTLASSATYSGGNSRIATLGSSLNFDGSAGGTVTNSTLDSLYKITFNGTTIGSANSNDTTDAAPYTLTGNGTGSVITLNGGVGNDSSNLQTINSNLDLGASQTFAATNGALTFGETVDLNPSGSGSGKTLTIAGANDVSFQTVKSTTGTGDLILNSTGTTTLGGTVDNFNLAATVNSGTLLLAKSASGPGGLGAGVRAVGSGLTIAGGLAQLGGTDGDQIYDNSNVIVTSGAFDTNGRNETINNLSLAGTGITGAGALLNSAAGTSTLTASGGITLAANSTVSVTQSGSTLALVGNATGAFTLTKAGSGTLSVTSSTASGFAPNAMNVQSGTLLLGASNVLGDSTSLTLSGGTFTSGGHNETLGALTLSSNSTIQLTLGDNTQDLRFSDYIRTGGLLTINDWTAIAGTTGTAGRLLFATSATFDGTELANIQFAGFGAGAQLIAFDGGFNELVPVPEPSGVAVALGLLGLAGLHQRRGRRGHTAGWNAPIGV